MFDATHDPMLVESLRILSAAMAALAAVAGAWLAFNSLQFLIEPFRMLSTVGVLGVCCGLLVAAALLLRRPGPGRVLAAVCAISAMFLVVGGLSHMGNLPFREAVVQATCMRSAAICYPQAATFMDSLAVLCVALLASSAASWRTLKRGV